MTMPRKRRILPRADHMLRYINEVILNNLRAQTEDTVITLPGVISRAYMLVNETATLEVLDLKPEHELVVKQ